MPTWDTAMERAREQAQSYACNLPPAELSAAESGGRPPFVIVVDVGATLEFYSEFPARAAPISPSPTRNTIASRWRSCALPTYGPCWPPVDRAAEPRPRTRRAPERAERPPARPRPRAWTRTIAAQLATWRARLRAITRPTMWRTSSCAVSSPCLPRMSGCCPTVPLPRRQRRSASPHPRHRRAARRAPQAPAGAPSHADAH